MQKHKNKKITVGVLCMTLMAFMVLPVYKLDVSAAQLSASNPLPFNAPWERYISSSDGLATLKYGYNEWAFNEDYAWATHATLNHYATLYNGNGWHTGANQGANAISKVEVRHSGSSVSYYCNY